MLGNITKTAVERLAADGQWLWDANHREVVKGFGARRQRDGIFYYLRYRVGGRQRVKSIGRHGSPWTPDMARSEARRLLGLVAGGTDPIAAPVAHAENLGAEVERYLSLRQPAMKPRAFTEIARHLRHHAKPLHRFALADISRRIVAERLAVIDGDSGPVARNRVRSSLHAFFAWSIREGLAETNPVAGTGKAEEGGSRERVLTDAELADIWRTLGDDQFSDIVRLLILTGQRRDEVGGMRWSEIDGAAALWTMPPQRTKNRREHAVPLSPAALAVIDRQPRRKNADGSPRDLIFGLGLGGFSGWSDCKARLNERLAATADWRLHDLRRTAATVMADKLGVLPHIIEAVLNHTSGHRAGVAGIYNRARYEAETRAALCAWADYVQSLGPPRPKSLRLVRRT
jgi:integrase